MSEETTIVVEWSPSLSCFTAQVVGSPDFWSGETWSVAALALLCDLQLDWPVKVLVRKFTDKGTTTLRFDPLARRNSVPVPSPSRG